MDNWLVIYTRIPSVGILLERGIRYSSLAILPRSCTWLSKRTGCATIYV